MSTTLACHCFFFLIQDFETYVVCKRGVRWGERRGWSASVPDSDIRQSEMEVSSLTVTAARLPALYLALMVNGASQMAQ